MPDLREKRIDQLLEAILLLLRRSERSKKGSEPVKSLTEDQLTRAFAKAIRQERFTIRPRSFGGN